MPWSEFLIIFVICVITIFLFRVCPMLALADREIPDGLHRALDYIPVAAFGALVTNDLFVVGAWTTGLWPAMLPLIASIPVIVVAIKTKSLALCILVGVAAYALLLLI